MTTQVFYRKWRPQSFSDVAGQEHVIQTLRNAIKSGRIAHAYLFCGPRGSGKTSTARILAKAVNCQKPVEGEPCNECTSCLAINKGSALDIIEIDEASNRGIDDMNDLKERVNYSPNLLKYKVYIIDEVHMITREGANAFLKTLEEPPPHVIFILATTDPHKIISTITSRCQRFDFHRLSSSSVISRLAYICEKEDIKTDAEVLKLITRITTGSLRDAINLLEQLITYYGDNISISQARDMLGTSGDLQIRALANHIISRDVSPGLKVINSVCSEGLDLRQFNKELVDFLRQLLLIKSGSSDMVDATADDLAEMQKLADSATLDYLLSAVKLFNNADSRINGVSSLPLELALVECVLTTAKEKAAPIESSGNRDWAQVKRPVPAANIPKPVDINKPAPVKSTKTFEQSNLITDLPAKNIYEAAKPDEPQLPEEPLNMENPNDLEYVRNHWKVFINSMRGEGSQGNLDARLRHACEPVELKDQNLVLGFYHEFHKSYIDNRKYLHLIEKKLKEVFGHSYTVSCVLISQNSQSEQKPVKNHLIEAALKMGAVIVDDNVETEEK